MTDFNELVPEKALLTFREVQEAGLIQEGMLFKLYRNGQIEVIKIGVKNHISRTELIRYLSENTIERTA